jgi:hypothetical protein
MVVSGVRPNSFESTVLRSFKEKFLTADFSVRRKPLASADLMEAELGKVGGFYTDGWFNRYGFAATQEALA